MNFIHELYGWPRLTWDCEVLSGLLADVRHKQGRLLGRMEALGFELRREASLVVLTSDVVKSLAIEGEALSPEEVRSSIARRLGLNVAGVSRTGRDVEGIVEMMLDATGKFDEPITESRLFAWHAALFPTGRSGMNKIAVGMWRPEAAGEMKVVSGPIGRERVHFEAPAVGRFNTEMQAFLDWFNGSPDVDPVLKAGVAHLWFVTIHPFEDGNGRIARAIGLPSPMKSVSSRLDRRNGSMTLRKLRNEVSVAGKFKCADRGPIVGWIDPDLCRRPLLTGWAWRGCGERHGRAGPSVANRGCPTGSRRARERQRG